MEYCQSVEKRVIKARFLKCINENKKRENKIKKFRKWCKIRVFPKKITAVPRKKLPQFPEKAYRSSPKKIPQFPEKNTAVPRKSYRSSPKKATAAPRKSSCSFRKSYRSSPKNNCIWAQDGQLPQFPEKWLQLSRSLSVTAVPRKVAALSRSLSITAVPRKVAAVKPKSVSYRSSPKSGCS